MELKPVEKTELGIKELAKDAAKLSFYIAVPWPTRRAYNTVSILWRGTF